MVRIELCKLRRNSKGTADAVCCNFEHAVIGERQLAATACWRVKCLSFSAKKAVTTVTAFFFVEFVSLKGQPVARSNPLSYFVNKKQV